MISSPPGKSAGPHATAPTDVTLDGYAGKQMELTTPADFAYDCDHGQIRIWTFAPGESDYRNLRAR